MIDIDRPRFEQMVGEALDTLPAEFTGLMRNVVVQVEDGDDPHLLGLYYGVPLTERQANDAGMMPDQISIYRLAILGVCTTEDDVIEEVRTTVVHEVGHHFGIDDDRLHELGY